MLRSMGSQRLGHDWATELNWPEQTTYSKCQDQAEWRKASWLPWRQPESCLPAPEEEADVMVHNLQVTEQRKAAQGPLAKMMLLSSGLRWKHASGKSELRWFLLRNQTTWVLLSAVSVHWVCLCPNPGPWGPQRVACMMDHGTFTTLGKSSALAVRDVTQISGHPWARSDISTQVPSFRVSPQPFILNPFVPALGQWLTTFPRSFKFS